MQSCTSHTKHASTASSHSPGPSHNYNNNNQIRTLLPSQADWEVRVEQESAGAGAAATVSSKTESAAARHSGREAAVSTTRNHPQHSTKRARGRHTTRDTVKRTDTSVVHPAATPAVERRTHIGGRRDVAGRLDVPQRQRRRARQQCRDGHNGQQLHTFCAADANNQRGAVRSRNTHTNTHTHSSLQSKDHTQSRPYVQRHEAHTKPSDKTTRRGTKQTLKGENTAVHNLNDVG